MAVTGSDVEIVLTIGAVARQLGVAVPTLRSWDRRYGLGPSYHVPGKHRRYTADDLARLRRMVALTGQGVPPAAAAQAARGDGTAEPGRDGGGSGALPVGRVEKAVRGLARAAWRFDVAHVQSLVASHIDERGVARTWHELLVPLLRSVEECYQRGDEIVAVEHSASAGILRALHGVPLPNQQQRLPALLACAPEEQHSLPLEALAAALAEDRCPARCLGARVPPDALRETARRLQPLTIVVSAHTTRHARRVPVSDLAAHCSALVLAGPGWDEVASSEKYLRPKTLSQACELVLDRAGMQAVSLVSGWS